MAENWGNPDTKSYKNNYIRRAIVDGGMLFVHKNILEVAEELLVRIAGSGVSFYDELSLNTTLDGYSESGSENKRLGLEFDIPTNKDLTGIGEDLGFQSVYEEPNMRFTFVGGAEERDLPSYFDQQTTKLGGKEVSIGHDGKDVVFIHYFLGYPEQKEIYDASSAMDTKNFQIRMGLPVQHGKWDSETWKAVIPRKHQRITGGDAGTKVRALQSALRANGYFCPVTSRFGTETVRTVRLFQEANGLRTTGRVGMLEWDLLFYYL